MPASPARKLSFADFVADTPALIAAKNIAMKFVQDIKDHPWDGGYCLTLAGKSGIGKTMLAKIIMAELGLNEWGYCSKIPRKFAAGKLLSFNARIFDMRKVSDGFKAGNYGIVDRMEEESLAILDDMGADHDPSRVTASKTDRVLRSRNGKWTVVTVNLPLAEIGEKLDNRIASFLIRDNNRFLEISADDFAKRKLYKKT
jgi:DNA replication protein DnaC